MVKGWLGAGFWLGVGGSKRLVGVDGEMVGRRLMVYWG